MILLARRDCRAAALSIVLMVGCVPLPATSRAPTELWQIASMDANSRGSPDAAFKAIADTWIVLDTISFRPAVSTRPLLPDPARERFAVVTSFQGVRYHPEVVRAMAESHEAVAASAGATASLLASASLTGLLIDFQEMTGDDRQILADVSHAFADSARAHVARQIGIIIPATDSAAYPAASLARIADFLVVKLFSEHGVGTPAGAIISPGWFARRLGARAGQIGGTRIVAGIRADGVLWTRDSTRRVSYTEAMRLVESAGVSIVRDAASQNLHAASTRDGWEVWVMDSEAISRLIAEARRFGVTRFAIFGADGADPGMVH
jgi:hypothetical protein